jgi:hypothetical protein
MKQGDKHSQGNQHRNDEHGKGDMSVREAGRKGGEIGGHKGGERVRELVEEGKQAEQRGGGSKHR